MKLCIHAVLGVIVLLGVGGTASQSSAADFESLFNGRDLTGWKGIADHWSVQDGTIVGETTKENRIDANTFLVWQGGEVTDFEFVAKVRFHGNNSGVQYRSKLLDEKGLVLSGYQMDFHPSPNFFGMLYAEKYEDRGKIATRGQRIEIDPEGKVTKLGTVGDKAKLTDWEWNTVRIVAVGDRLIHQINGVTTIDVIDRHKSALAKGLLGLQLHKGPPMRVEFEDLKLRQLDEKASQELIREITDEPKTPKKPTPAPKTKDRGQGENAMPSVKGLTVAKGFKVELVYTVPLETQGSWVSLTSR